jgi:hypothetical protein
MATNKQTLNKIIYFALWILIGVPELYLIIHDFSNPDNLIRKIISHIFYLFIIYYVLIRKLSFLAKSKQ